METSNNLFDEALNLVGELLADRGQSYEVVAIGGASLLLLGLIQRPTRDLDLVARIKEGQYQPSHPMPAPLLQAAREVGRALGLADNWLNGGPSDLLRFGLPEGFEKRTQSRAYGNLTLHISGRFDQICFKLYAAVDRGPKSKHFADLKRLAPTRDELLAAKAWCVTHDPSDPFADQLSQALTSLGVNIDDA